MNFEKRKRERTKKRANEKFVVSFERSKTACTTTFRVTEMKRNKLKIASVTSYTIVILRNKAKMHLVKYSYIAYTYSGATHFLCTTRASFSFLYLLRAEFMIAVSSTAIFA